MCGILGQIAKQPIEKNTFQKTLLLINKKAPGN